MSFLLDTDTASAFLRGEAGVFGRFMQHSGGLYISILSVAELYAWVFVTDKPEKREVGLTAMLHDVNIVESGESKYPVLCCGLGYGCTERTISPQRHATEVTGNGLWVTAGRGICGYLHPSRINRLEGWKSTVYPRNPRNPRSFYSVF